MKKTIVIVALMVFTIHINAQEINWVSFEEAIALQKKKPKKIMMDVYTNWCGPCKMLDKNTFHNKDVVDYVNKNYYAVKFNAEGDESINFNGKTYTNPNYDPAKANRRNSIHELARYFSIRSYPTIVFLGEDAEFLAPIIGYKKPQELEMYLKMFYNGDYKSLETQNEFYEYKNNFIPKFAN